MFFQIMVVDIKIGGIKNKKLQKLRRKIEDLASDPAQDALGTLPALSAQASTGSKRIARANRENMHLC